MVLYTPRELAQITSLLKTNPSTKEIIALAKKLKRPVQGFQHKCYKMLKEMRKAPAPVLDIIPVPEDTPVKINGVSITFPGNRMIFDGIPVSW